MGRPESFQSVGLNARPLIASMTLPNLHHVHDFGIGNGGSKTAFSNSAVPTDIPRFGQGGLSEAVLHNHSRENVGIMVANTAMRLIENELRQDAGLHFDDVGDYHFRTKVLRMEVFLEHGFRFWGKRIPEVWRDAVVFGEAEHALVQKFGEHIVVI